MTYRKTWTALVIRAGRSFETEADVQRQQGLLLQKGLKSQWRQAPGERTIPAVSLAVWQSHVCVQMARV